MRRRTRAAGPPSTAKSPTLSSRRSTSDNPATREDPLRNAIRLVIGLAVSGLCFWVATRGVDWAQVRDALAGAHPLWAVAGVAGGVVAFWLRAVRWQVLLRPVQPVPLGPAFSATSIGFAATAVLPFRLGEIVRPALLGQRTGMGLTPALSSVVVERILDMLMVVTCALVLSLHWTVPEWLRHATIVLATGAFGGFAVLLLAQRFRGVADRVLDLALGVLPGGVGRAVRPMVDGLFAGVAGLRDGRTLLELVVLSVVLWTVNGIPFGFAFWALDIQAPFAGGSLACLVVVAAAVFLPQAPGFVGTWQMGCTAALAIFHVPDERAVAFSLLTWVIQIVTSVGLGGICLAREDLSVSDMLRRPAAVPVTGAEG
jgi:uncharacterized protein (TIRG00374 family)